MSIKQERMKNELWEKVNEENNEEDIHELQLLKAELSKLSDGSTEYKQKKKEYDRKHTLVENFYMKFSD